MRTWTKVSSYQFTVTPLLLSAASIQVWMAMATISLMHLVVGFYLGGRLGLFLGFCLATTLMVLVFFFGDAQLLKFFKAKAVRGQDPWNLNDLALRYSRIASVPTPTVYLAENSSPFAFSQGQYWKHSFICVSSGLLERFSQAEIEAIIAHQVCHVRKIESFRFGIFSALAHALVAIKALRWLLTPLAWILIKAAVSSRSFLENDDLVSSFLPDRKTLAQALWKLEAYSQTLPVKTLPCSHHLFIVSPQRFEMKQSRLQSWLRLQHPSIESRIRRLTGSFPI